LAEALRGRFAGDCLGRQGNSRPSCKFRQRRARREVGAGLFHFGQGAREARRDRRCIRFVGSLPVLQRVANDAVPRKRKPGVAGDGRALCASQGLLAFSSTSTPGCRQASPVRTNGRRGRSSSRCPTRERFLRPKARGSRKQAFAPPMEGFLCEITSGATAPFRLIFYIGLHGERNFRPRGPLIWCMRRELRSPSSRMNLNWKMRRDGRACARAPATARP
jgi:hypothetical protein